jgi:prepilin-type N-terminal cleavage/methylation domain-containing protein
MQKGFTLVEMALVIVVIAIISSLVFGGVVILRQSQLRTVIAESTGLITSIRSFHLKYRYLPGDMPIAHEIWGDECDAIADRCNGDGNGHIDVATQGMHAEGLRFWQHMRLASMLPGIYSGYSVENPPLLEIGINIPRATAFLSAGYTVDYQETFSQMHSGEYQSSPQNFLHIGGLATNRKHGLDPLFKAHEAAFLDRKMDDGLPDHGQVYSLNALLPIPSCISGKLGHLQYNLDSDHKDCHLMWKIP